MALHTALRHLYESNAPAEAAAFVDLVVKLLEGAAAGPGDEQRRRLNVFGRAYQDRIQPIDGAAEVMAALGFQREERGPGKLFLVLPERLASRRALEPAILALQAARPLYDSDDALALLAAGQRPAAAAAAADDAPSEAMQLLLSMGFARGACAAALRSNGGNAEAALNALLASAGDGAPPQLQQRQGSDAARRLAAELDRQERAAMEAARREEEAATARFLEMEHQRERDRLTAIAMQDEEKARQMFDQDVSHGAQLPLQYRNILLLGPRARPEGPFRCPVCFGDDFALDRVIVLSCTHVGCVDCARQHMETAIRDKSPHVACPFSPECKRAVEVEEIKLCVARESFDAHLLLLTKRSLESAADCRFCPKCETPMFGDRAHPMMVCHNRACGYKFCFNCNTEAWHSGSTCEAYQTWKRENSQADTLFARWAAANTKQCPNCRAVIEKNGGCDHMTCSRCRKEWYWSSMRPYP